MNLGVLLVLGLAGIVLANEVPQAIDQLEHTNQGEQHYADSSEDNEEEKRAWKDLSGSGWGKRGWQDLQSAGWGKRGWSDLNGAGWGKRGWSNLAHAGYGKRAWSDLQSGWGKRAWKDLHGSGWGKRAWKDLQAAGWGKRSMDEMRYGDDSDENLSLEDPEDKRSWSNLRGTWGKRADWSSFKGPNEYSIEDSKNYKL